jgi:signal transduction histidine kinase
VRLALPLRYDDAPVGLWLLGRLDPDDWYSQAEIDDLRVLADQIALAVVHMRQAGRLRAYLHDHVDRLEREHSRLARDLHDTVLNDLVALQMSAEAHASPLLQPIVDVIARFRKSIGGSRPPVVQFGLHTMLEALADEAEERAPPGVVVYLEVPPSEADYPDAVKLQVQRILRQATDNALRHAEPAGVWISGCLEPGYIDLTVRDDGQGFLLDERGDLARLEAEEHFGLVGMFERADLIHAVVRIHSAPGQGTRVQLTWEASPARPQTE